MKENKLKVQRLTRFRTSFFKNCFMEVKKKSTCYLKEKKTAIQFQDIVVYYALQNHSQRFINCLINLIAESIIV